MIGGKTGVEVAAWSGEVVRVAVFVPFGASRSIPKGWPCLPFTILPAGSTLAPPAEIGHVGGEFKRRKTPIHMGDKSPKSTQKKNSQKEAKASSADQKKKSAAAAQSAAKKK